MWILKRSLLAVALPWFLAGCVRVGPEFKTPPAPISQQWKEAGNAALDTHRQEYQDWWKVFNDPVLTRLIDTAARQNLTLLQAGVRVVEARAQLAVAVGQFFPQQQQLVSSVTYNRIPISIPYKLLNNTYWADSFGAQVGWELDLWGKLRRAIESADDSYLASVATYDDVLVTLIGDVASTYIQVRTSQAQIAIARSNLERQREALELARIRFSFGVVTKRDVYQAENVLGSTEATIPALTVSLEQSENALSVLLGMPPGHLETLLAAPAPIPAAPISVAVGIPADLLLRRPDVRSAELKAAARCAMIGYTKADLFPTITVTGYVGTMASTISGNGLADMFNGNNLVFSFGPSLKWSILNYGQITNQVRVQDAEFQELLLDYQNTVLKAQQEVENGIAMFMQSRKQVAALNESVSAADGALNIAIIQYRQGIATFTDVLTAEQQLLQAENSLALGQEDIALGLVAVYRALGGGWQLNGENNFVPAGIREEMRRRTNWGNLLAPPSAPVNSDLPSPKNSVDAVRLPQW